MTWKQTGKPSVRQQRGRWVVRVDGVDVESGKPRPRQLGTYPSQRAAKAAAARAIADGDVGSDRRTVGWLVDRWVASRMDVGAQAKAQYEWAAQHIGAGLGALRVDQLDRTDVARWLERLATEGNLARRSIQIFRTVLRAALEDAVEEGVVRRNPAGRVPMPRVVAKPGRTTDAEAWDEDQVQCFVAAASSHRWSAPMRLLVLYGLRRSELLALRWPDLDLKAGRVVVDEGLVLANGKQVWTEGKNARSRRTIPIDEATVTALKAHRKLQAEERLLAGAEWEDSDLVVTTRTGRSVDPRNFNTTLDRVVKAAGLPRLTTHGLRHTATTHMVRQAVDAGELRAVADVLGHSPDMLMRVYAHALPDSLQKVADRIGQRPGL